MATIADLRQQFKAGKQALIDGFMAERPTQAGAQALLRRLARHVDETLRALWQQSAQAGMPAGACLVAVGGYGRGELFPHSDVDVLVLLPDGAEAYQPGPVKSAIESFITSCWDVGLEIGSSVRTLGECLSESQGDVTIQTALLEARALAGDARLFKQLARSFMQAMDAKAFLRAKTLEGLQRHTKFDETPYALEPNCKESPGGLRDLQMLVWIARAAGLGKTWKALSARGLITAFESRQLQRNEGQLKLIRARLHAVAGRREDRLVFDLQTAVAQSFGFVATESVRASELLMRRYYWAAKAVTQLHQILLLNLEEQINGSQQDLLRPIDGQPDYLDRGRMLEVASDDLYQRDPHAILRTFLVYQQTPGIKGLSARTLRALYNARGLMDAAWRRDPVNRATFMAMLRAPEGQTHAFRLMNQTSVLGRYLWVFRAIVGQMQHDLFHVYTVDQHILMVLRNVRRFFIPEHAHEYPFCSQLAVQFDTPELLYIAALFHDVAKGRGGDHSELGAVEVRRFCRQHGLGADDTALCVFLVEHHLTMSRVAQKEDLSDPEVIAAFAAKVGDARRLTALYLLTVADIRGTSPKVWNAWKGKLLEDLYRITLRALAARASTSTPRSRRASRRPARSWRCARSCPAPRSRCGRSWPSAISRGTTAPSWPGMRARCGATWTRRCRWCAPAPPPSARACRCWSTPPTSRTCSRASAATSTAPASASSTPRSTPPATAMRSTPFRSSGPRPTCTTATWCRWSSRSWARRCRPAARCPSRDAGGCRAGSRASPTRRASRCAPTSVPPPGC